MLLHNSARMAVACILLSIVTSSCADNSEEAILATQTPIEERLKPEVAKTRFVDFGTFYEAFSNTVTKGDWSGLAELTRFPFVLKGELDSEEKVQFEKVEFIKNISDILSEEIYLNSGDELIAMNFFQVVSRPGDSLEVYEDKAYLSGLMFSRDAEGWRFSGVSTHVHIVENYFGK